MMASHPVPGYMSPENCANPTRCTLPPAVASSAAPVPCQRQYGGREQLVVKLGKIDRANISSSAVLQPKMLAKEWANLRLFPTFENQAQHLGFFGGEHLITKASSFGACGSCCWQMLPQESLGDPSSCQHRYPPPYSLINSV